MDEEAASYVDAPMYAGCMIVHTYCGYYLGNVILLEDPWVLD